MNDHIKNVRNIYRGHNTSVHVFSLVDAYFLSLFFFFLAINSLAGTVMTLGMIASDVVCDSNPKICYLDSATAILIAFALLSYGVM